MQKIIKTVMIAFLAGVIATSCSQDSDLPYPINDVKEGVLVDISQTPNTDGFIDAIAPNVQPNLGVTLNLVPKGDGDWDKIDLVIIYQNSVDNTFSKFVYQENITSLPQTIDLDYNTILEGFGIERENPGDNFHVVIDIYLPNGLVVFGWTPYTGFTNTDFASWQFNGRGYSRRVVYPAACPIDPDFWAGPAQSLDVGEGFYEESLLSVLPEDDVPASSYFENLGMDENEVNALDLVGFELEGFFLDSDPLTMEGNTSKIKFWINKASFQVFIPDQPTGLSWNIGAALGGADDFQEIWVTEVVNAEANTCNGTISFTSDWMPIGDSGYGFGEMAFQINVLAFNEQVKNLKNSRTDILKIIGKR
jgi:hypothetical protein